jgi:fatty acid desaturase
MWIPWKASRFEVETDIWRYKLRRRGDPLSMMLADWGAQVHFLYCAGWAVLLAILCIAVTGLSVYCLAERIALVIAFVLLVAGVIHHVRMLVMMQEYKSAYSDEQLNASIFE